MMVYVIRHAWAEEADSSRWPDDSQRPLTEEGRSRFRKFARRLLRRGLTIDLIGTSPFVRCVETAEILMEVHRGAVALEVVSALAPKGNFEEILDWLASRSRGGCRDIALVGHAPDVNDLIRLLIGGGNIDCPKGCVAAIEFPNHPTAGQGRLLYLVSAPLLKC